MKLPIIVALCVSTTSAFAAKRDWKRSVVADVTHCFETKNVKAICEPFDDGMAELQIEAVNYVGHKFYYSYFKALPASHCRDHLSGIHRLLKGTDQACITGGYVFTSDNETSFRWTAFETRRGEITW